MVEINIAYEGGLRCRAQHGPSDTELVTDAPVDTHGKGESFSPTDLVATALGTCVATIMGILAERHDIDLDLLTTRYKRIFTESMTAGEYTSARQALDSIAKQHGFSDAHASWMLSIQAL